MDTLNNFPPDFLCTDVSLAVDEPLYGSAVHATTWFLLEVRGGWRAKAPSDNDLPAHIDEWLQQQMDGVKNGRLQFIRQGKAREGQPYAFYVAQTHETEPRLYRFDLNSYDDLLALHMTDILTNAPAVADYLIHEPMIAVCTHGKRDRCCSLYGLPILNKLREMIGDNVWQTTHTGGHRFAPTLVTFPDGALYGRLSTDDLPELVHGVQNGRLLLNKLRGRTCYTAVEQVADYLLRHETMQPTRAAYKLIRTEQHGSQWHIIFAKQDTEQVHTIIIEKDPNPLTLFGSSGSYKTKEVDQYTFVTHETTLTD